MKDPELAVGDRIIEFYRCNDRLALYKFVSDCFVNQTTSTFGWKPLADVVEETINYTSSWTSKAIRIGLDFIAFDGKSTTLARPVECAVDWNVTQLNHLCRLSKEEVAFLVGKGFLSPAMTGDEVWGVVKDYLEDPDRKLMNEFRSLSINPG